MNSAATQITSAQFDQDFFRLSPLVQEQIQAKIDLMGSQLASFPHFRMAVSNNFRLRVGDYRVIYRFDLKEGLLFLTAIGHRREIYR
jgi:mRNA-degrading endonuclease RelE of RelBE toxin-antitoxin system